MRVEEKGSSLLALIAIVAIVAITFSIVFPGYVGKWFYYAPGTVTQGIIGATETKCLQGFVFIVGKDGTTQQVLNAQGAGVQCNP